MEVFSLSLKVQYVHYTNKEVFCKMVTKLIKTIPQPILEEMLFNIKDYFITVPCNYF